MTPMEGDIEALSRAILDEARAETDELKADARLKADAIRQKARAEADRARRTIMEQATQEAERLKSQAVASAQLKARTLELAQREQMLDRVFSAVAERLSAVPRRSDYPTIAKGLLREAVSQLRSGDVEIRADEATQKMLDTTALQELSKELKVQVHLGKPLEAGLGVLVQTDDGHLQFDNTLQTRLARLQSALRSKVYRILVGESE